MVSFTQLVLLVTSLIGSLTRAEDLPQQDIKETLQPRWLNTAFAPYFASGNCIYGSFYDGSYNFNPRFTYGANTFYTTILPSYTTWCPAGIYGYSAGYVSSGSYSFFKSTGDDIARHTTSLQRRSVNLRLEALEKRDDRVQCRNEKGQQVDFSRSECDTAATKMASEKTAVSTSGTCSLVMVGPQGQLSSSTLPASEIQAETQNILNACATGPMGTKQSGSIKISSNAKPTYVLLLTKVDGKTT